MRTEITSSEVINLVGTTKLPWFQELIYKWFKIIPERKSQHVLKCRVSGLLPHRGSVIRCANGKPYYVQHTDFSENPTIIIQGIEWEIEPNPCGLFVTMYSTFSEDKK